MVLAVLTILISLGAGALAVLAVHEARKAEALWREAAAAWEKAAAAWEKNVRKP